MAKYLLDALRHVNRKQWAESDKFIQKARRLSPDYFEVHRVEAWKYFRQNNMPAARTSYEAAIELNPESAPLRLWYGKFLLHIAETPEAHEQLHVGHRLDSTSIPLRIELARTGLYLHRYDEATAILEECLDEPDDVIGEDHLRKSWDLLMQVHRRKADGALQERETRDSLRSCIDFRKTFEACPRWLIDGQMMKHVDGIQKTATVIGRKATDETVKETFADFVEWCISEVHRPLSAPRAVVGNAHGVVREVQHKQAYGFILLDDGRSAFFHRSYLAEENDWGIIEEGLEVKCTVTPNEKGLEARNVHILAGFDSSTRTGVVRRMRDNFGFIQTESGGELFFHRSSMRSEMDEWSDLTEGSCVEFAVAKNTKGPAAVDVRIVSDNAN